MRISKVGKVIQILLDEHEATEVAGASYWVNWAEYPVARELFGKLDEITGVSL